MSDGDTEKIAKENARKVEKGVKNAKNSTIYGISSAGDSATDGVMEHSAKETEKYTKKAEGMYKDAAKDVKEERKEQFKKVEEDAAEQAEESKVRIIKNADRIAAEKATEANIKALKIAAADAKAVIKASHTMERDVEEATHRARQAARNSYAQWRNAKEQADFNKDYTVNAYQEAQISKYEALGAGEQVQTALMGGNMATQNSLHSQQESAKVDWKAKTVKTLANKIKAQVDTTQGAITRLTTEIESAIKEASAANKDARAAQEHAKNLIKMGALGKPTGAAPGAAPGPGGPGAPGPAGFAPGAAIGYAPGAAPR